MTNQLAIPYLLFTSSAMGKTTKVNKDMSLANHLILENDLSVLSVRLYTDINGILFILGLTLFISLVNSFLVLHSIFSARNIKNSLKKMDSNFTVYQ